MARYPRRGGRFFLDFEDEEDEEIENVIFLNRFRTTYYLGRGRFGDNSRLHRGMMIIRELEREGRGGRARRGRSR
jgi:hypothetical protein